MVFVVLCESSTGCKGSGIWGSRQRNWPGIPGNISQIKEIFATISWQSQILIHNLAIPPYVS